MRGNRETHQNLIRRNERASSEQHSRESRSGSLEGERVASSDFLSNVLNGAFDEWRCPINEIEPIKPARTLRRRAFKASFRSILELVHESYKCIIFSTDKSHNAVCAICKCWQMFMKESRYAGLLSYKTPIISATPKRVPDTL